MASKTRSSKHSSITLGWQVTPTLDPRYWLKPNAKAGNQEISDLVRISSESLATHTAIIAQSGSGKSFFLARLIEELLIETRSNCLIFDPNADFRKVAEVVDAKYWREATYDPRLRRGHLPHESSRERFRKRWAQVSVSVLSGQRFPGSRSKRLKLWWPSLSVDFFSEDLGPVAREEVYHCHRFVKSLAMLLLLKQRMSVPILDVIKEAEKLTTKGQGEELGRFRSFLATEFSVEDLCRRRRLSTKDQLLCAELISTLPQFDSVSPKKIVKEVKDLSLYKFLLKAAVKELVEQLIEAVKCSSENMQRFYFGIAQEYKQKGILSTTLNQRPSQIPLKPRLNVLDLPSLPDRTTRLLSVNAILAMEWIKARQAWSAALDTPSKRDKRSPTFIVVDEAHNLIPRNIAGKAEGALVEQFRTITAEGRKYGLFLILVTQRPDKLDPLVLSACENTAIMHLGSKNVLQLTQQLLGLEDIPNRLLDRCLEFEVGRALLIGRWAPKGPQLVYGAMRRTVEGGRNLNPEHWTVPAVPALFGPTRGRSRKIIKKKTKKKKTTGKSSIRKAKKKARRKATHT